MKVLSALAAFFEERANPIMVKEFRQAVRSRLVIALLALFLAVNLSILGGYLLLNPDAATAPDGGRDMFAVLLAILLITCIVFVPFYTGIRLSLERNDANIDLFFITTITPGAIVRGKYLSAMALTLLIFSVCMPFIAFTYLLRGVDLPTIFLALTLGFMFCAITNAVGVFAGSISGGLVARGIVGWVMAMTVFYEVVMVIGVIVGEVRFGMASFGRGSAFWTFLAVWTVLEVLAIGLLYVLSVALLSSRLSNRMLIPRIYLTVCWALTGIAVEIWSLIEGRTDLFETWIMTACVVLIGLVVLVLGERDAWSLRVRRGIPRSPLLRPIAFLFYTGSGGGLLWCVALFAATVAAGFNSCSGNLSVGLAPHGYQETLSNMTVVFGYILCYCLTTVFFRLTFLQRAPTQNLSMIAVVFGVFVYCVPLFLAFFLSQRWESSMAWYVVGSPLVLSMGNIEAVTVGYCVVAAWLVLGSLAGVPWLLGQWRRFVPLPKAEVVLASVADAA
jgi:hypothetical protein